MAEIKLKNDLQTEGRIYHKDGDSAYEVSIGELANSVKQVDTIADLRLQTTTPNTLWVSGYHTKGDGAFGSNIFEWDAPSVEADNGGTIIKLDSVATGRYKLKYSGSVNVKWFGVVGNTGIDYLTEIQSACDTLASTIILPSGTIILSGGLSIAEYQTLKGEHKTTILKRQDNSISSDALLTLSSFSKVENILIDGNATNQTIEALGIWGLYIQSAEVLNVKVYDNYGIGIGWNSCYNCLCEKVEVTRTKAYRAGFWNDSYSTDSFYGDGGHKYIDCISTYSDLDGISIGTKDNIIIRGNYSYNGETPPVESGALGGAGIFTLDGETLENITVSGAVCSYNYEYGINVGVSNSKIEQCTCNNNQLSGIFIKNGYRNILTENSCYDNGWYTGSLNPTLWQRAGINFYPDVSFTIISNNTCYDSGISTQEYGIRFSKDASTEISRGMVISSNNSKYNKIDSDNINPSGYQYDNLTELEYLDFLGSENPSTIITADSPTLPNVCKIVYLNGTFNLTTLSGGRENQIITIAVISGFPTVGGTSFNLTSSTIQLVGYMSSITLVRRGSIWHQIGSTSL